MSTKWNSYEIKVWFLALHLVTINLKIRFHIIITKKKKKKALIYYFTQMLLLSKWLILAIQAMEKKDLC
jgi:uncharacterized membrane protein